MSRELFIEIVTADQPDAPAYFTYDAVLNTREHDTLDQALARELNPLSRQEVLAGVEDGAQLLDTREGAQFEGAHLRGSVNIGLGGSFATWCGTVLDRERPIVLIAEPGRELEAAVRLGRIGFDNVDGYLDGGMQPLEDAPELVDRIERITAGSLAEQLASTDSAVGGRRPQPGRMARTPDRRGREPAAVAVPGRPGDDRAWTTRGRLLRQRISLRDRRQPAAAGRHGARQRPRRWSRRMAGGEAAGHLHGLAAGAPETHDRGR